jgi:hypothetical protein
VALGGRRRLAALDQGLVARGRAADDDDVRAYSPKAAITASAVR